MSDLVTGLKLTGTSFVTSIVQISYPWFHQEAEERPTGSKGCPAHREMKFVSDEDTTSTQPQTHAEVRREMREKNFSYLMAELEDHYANASKNSPALPSTLWVRQWEPKPFLFWLNRKLQPQFSPLCLQQGKFPRKYHFLCVLQL